MNGDAKREKRIHDLFIISVCLKGLHALIELAGGIALLFVSTGTIARVLTWLTREELAEDPHDMIAQYFRHLGEEMSLSAQQFGSFYLVSHCIVNLAIVVGLLKKTLWTYPAALATRR